MDPRADGTRILCLPRAFINRKGEAILIHTLDEKISQRLIDMYLAYQPRNSFQGLPPMKDDACIKWVQHMIGNGLNVVALSFERGVVGHIALFPFDNVTCELFVVVAKDYQNTGIGTELTRSGVQLSYEVGFEKIWLDVESTNLRARHVYKRCGFEYVTTIAGREIEMQFDLNRYRRAVSATAEQIMNRDSAVIEADASCRVALGMFLAYGAASLPVVGHGRELVGVLSEWDLMQPLNLDKHARDVLTQETPTAEPNTPLMSLIRMFQSSTAGCIPIVDPQRKLVGIVSRRDILAHYAAEFPGATGESK